MRAAAVNISFSLQTDEALCLPPSQSLSLEPSRRLLEVLKGSSGGVECHLMKYKYDMISVRELVKVLVCFRRL